MESKTIKLALFTHVQNGAGEFHVILKSVSPSLKFLLKWYSNYQYFIAFHAKFFVQPSQLHRFVKAFFSSFVHFLCQKNISWLLVEKKTVNSLKLSNWLWRRHFLASRKQPTNKNWFLYSIIVLLLHRCRTHLLTIGAHKAHIHLEFMCFLKAKPNKTNRSAWRKKQPEPNI